MSSLSRFWEVDKMATLRIATFNCENLFSRPTVLNYADNDTALEPLSEIAELNKALAKPKYTASDKTKIKSLVDELEPYIDVNELRDRLISTHKVNGKMVRYTKADGRSSWVGGIRLKRANLPLGAQKSTAEVIKAVDADVQCMAEVEDRITLDAFSRQFLKNSHSYAYNMLIDGNDDRGIDVALLTRLEISDVKTHIFDTENGSSKRIFSRDCLELTLKTQTGRNLFLLINHFKSKLGPQGTSNAKRKAQAERVAEILESYDLKKDLVAVAGDFNDTPDSAPLQALLTKPNLTDVLVDRFPNAADRWTYRDKKQIDYLLVSRPLSQAVVDVGIERRGLFNAEKLTGGQVKSFPTVLDNTTDASDHCAVWAEFDI
jgi:endonuclease/exonuclease/phosphatase family metal-dependent hydrolase